MRARFASNSRTGLFLFLAVYAGCLAVLLPVLSLWLDEIYDLIVARMDSLTDLLAYVPHISGNVPLHYMIQFASVHLLGSPAFSGRLPSAISSVAACAGVFVLARRMSLRRPLLAAGIFALFPLQLRYALEARPYELALCLSIWATVAFLRLMEQPESVVRAALYGLCVAAGLYTFPFTLFVPVANLAWLLVTRRWRPLLTAGLAVGIAGLVFAPWYLHSAASWREAVVAGQLKDTIGLRAIPMVLRELTGAGYGGTALTLIGVWFGLSKGRDRLLWILYAIVPVLCAVAADAFFGYFLAIRQMIFVLAPLALLFAAGVESLNRRAGALLAAALVLATLAGNFNFFRRPRENWQTAAVLLAAEECVVYSPADSRQLYAFFVPPLATRECSPGKAKRVALAISPYAANNPSGEARRQLAESGFVKQAELNPATPRIEVYQRP
jgi:4-amino-4-deoxy-L-arabinose transferase-like glycosyltransferase